MLGSGCLSEAILRCFWTDFFLIGIYYVCIVKLALTSEPVPPTEAEPSDDFLKDDIFEDFIFFLIVLLSLLLFEVIDFPAFGIGEGFILWEFEDG